MVKRKETNGGRLPRFLGGKARPVRVLSIDGGGIRGILPAMVLHAAYGGGMMLVTLGRLGDQGEVWWTRAAWLAPLGLLLCLVPKIGSRKS